MRFACPRPAPAPVVALALAACALAVAPRARAQEAPFKCDGKNRPTRLLPNSSPVERSGLTAPLFECDDS